MTPPKYNSESQVCSWDGKKWIVSDIVVPEILEPKAKVFPEPEEEPVSEPEPYIGNNKAWVYQFNLE